MSSAVILLPSMPHGTLWTDLYLLHFVYDIAQDLSTEAFNCPIIDVSRHGLEPYILEVICLFFSVV